MDKNIFTVENLKNIDILYTKGNSYYIFKLNEFEKPFNLDARKLAYFDKEDFIKFMIEQYKTHILYALMKNKKLNLSVISFHIYRKYDLYKERNGE